MTISSLMMADIPLTMARVSSCVMVSEIFELILVRVWVAAWLLGGWLRGCVGWLGGVGCVPGWCGFHWQFLSFSFWGPLGFSGGRKFGGCDAVRWGSVVGSWVVVWAGLIFYVGVLRGSFTGA